MGKAIQACWVFALMICAQVARAEERVTIESAHYRVGELQQRLARERGETLTSKPGEAIEAWLSRPDGPGPFPAIVVLHGCSGLRPASRAADAAQFTGWGYVVLVVDSYATRGIKQTCDNPMPDRHADAIGALAYLAQLPFVDPQRIALLGRSQGGIAGLQVASSPPDVFDVSEGLVYKAVVAFYPYCGVAADEVSIPTLVMTGDADDWSPVKDCERWMARRAGRGAPVKFIVYPGVHHAFDVAAVGDGVTIFGHRLKYDADAAARSTAEMRAFLAAHLGR